MDMPDIRLVASDMDGTLLNSKAELPPDFFDIFARMRRHGVAFAAASGRQIHNMKIKFGGAANEIYFAAENGAYVLKGEREMLSLELTREQIRAFLEIARKIDGAYIVLSGKKFAYIENPDPIFLARLSSYSGFLKPVADISQIEGDVFYKFTICDLINPRTNSLPRFESLMGDFQIKVSGLKWMDITHKLADKGYAIKLIQDELGVSEEQTAAFGDYLNDIEMLKRAKYSFAMANALDEIKKLARFQTYSYNESGVTKALDKLIGK
ncbi:MAG: HAD family hydrolase [Opitutales bacterium]|nr:HAD family hydrolase [Opitutales bacterium]